ncbi:MAG: WecB/TagA/CpsF family glycosyltransferase [Patescibacteria group bacterium]
MIKKENYLGIEISVASEDKILEYLYAALAKPHKKLFIVTPNPELIILAHDDPSYKKVLNEAALSLPDGVGLLMASKLLGKPLPGRITGVDFIERVCAGCHEKPLSIGFLGAGLGVAKTASERLKKKYPWIKVVYVATEWENSENVGSASRHPASTSSTIMSVGAQAGNPTTAARNFVPEMDILFVAFGSPKQEIWIHEHFNELPATAIMGVGGSFDFISNNIARAPGFMQAIGLEWFFRLIRQPWRIRRQLSLLRFVWIVMAMYFDKLRCR